MQAAVWVAAWLAISAAAKSLCVALLQAWVAAHQASTIDSEIYWAVGRGIVNGLMPYQDLFETKPPGIFLLTALSLKLGSTGFAIVLHALCLALLPVPIAAYAWLKTKGMKTIHRIAVLTGTWAFAGMLATFASIRTGMELQVETFGAALGVMYAFLIIHPPRHAWVQVAASSALLFVAMSFKEPFLLVFAACALLLCRTKTSFWRHFTVPVMCVAICGVFALSAFSYMQPYFDIYLPHMLGYHVSAFGSPWVRGLFPGPIFTDLEADTPFFGVSIVFLLVAVLAMRLMQPKTLRHHAVQTAAMVAALYLTSLAVGLGGQYFWHHFLFAAPLYAAAALEFIRLVTAPKRRPLRMRYAAVLAGLGFLATFSIGMPDIDVQLPKETERAEMAALAERIDAILDACGESRYLFLGKNSVQPYGLTRHSPLGPYFFQLPEFFDASLPEARARFREQLKQAKIIVYHENGTGPMRRETHEYLTTHFSLLPWKCAGKVENGAGSEYQLLFRKAAGPRR